MTTYPTNPMIDRLAQQSASEAAAIACQRISPIDEAMGSLRNTQGATIRLLDELASRLEPVLGSEPNVGKDDAKGLHASQLHGEILACGYNADTIHARIRGLIERLTV